MTNGAVVPRHQRSMLGGDIINTFVFEFFERGRALKVTTERQDDHQVKLTLVLDSQDLERAKRRVAREYARRLKFPGFRPGKAPYELVARRVGEETIKNEAIERLLDEYYPQALKEAEIEPFGPGTLKEIVSTDPPTFELLVPLKPEVDLGEYRNLRLPFEPPTVDEEMVEQVIESYRQMFAVVEPVDRPAEVGDIVYVDVEVYEKGQEDGDPLLAEPNHPVLIEEEDDENEWLFPGFARTLLGAQAGDTKTLEHTFSEDEEDETLRGKTAVIQVEVMDVKARKVPELDDEFARQLGTDSAEAFRRQVRDQLEQEALNQYKNEYYEKAIERLLEQATLRYPPQMVAETLDELWKEAQSEAEKRGMTWEAYLTEQEVDEEGLKARLREQAEDIVRRRLILEEIAKAEDVHIAPEQVTERARASLVNILAPMDKKDARRLAKDKEFINRLIMATWEDELLQTAMERVIAIAKGDVKAEESEVKTGEEEENSAHGVAKEAPKEEQREEAAKSLEEEAEA